MLGVSTLKPLLIQPLFFSFLFFLSASFSWIRKIKTERGGGFRESERKTHTHREKEKAASLFTTLKAYHLWGLGWRGSGGLNPDPMYYL